MFDNQSPRFQLRLFAEVVLYKLYEAHFDDSAPDFLSSDNICKLFAMTISRKFVESVLSHLRADFPLRALTRRGTVGQYQYKLSNEGIVFIEDQIKRRGSLMSYYAANGDAHIDKVAGFNAIFKIEDNFLDGDDYKPVEFNTNSAEFQSLMSSLSICRKAIIESNSFEANFPAEKSQILLSLDAGINALESGTVVRQKTIDNIARPLNWVGSVLSETALKTLAADAVQHLLVFLRSLF